MTDEEKKEIVAEVIQTLKTNAVTVDQLNEVSSYTSNDYVELNKGRKMRVDKIEENIASGIDKKYSQTIQNLGEKYEEIEAYAKKITTEYNVSTFFPMEGTNGSNKYDLASAIGKVPAELRTEGLKVSFLNSAGKPESWKYQGGSWTVASFIQESAGGNKILTWVTDAATTRKQVSANERKGGMQISYKPDNEDWVNEQYVGTSFTDTEWAKDANWVSIPRESEVAELSHKLDNCFLTEIANVNVESNLQKITINKSLRGHKVRFSLNGDLQGKFLNINKNGYSDALARLCCGYYSDIYMDNDIEYITLTNVTSEFIGNVSLKLEVLGLEYDIDYQKKINREYIDTFGGTIYQFDDFQYTKYYVSVKELGLKAGDKIRFETGNDENYPYGYTIYKNKFGGENIGGISIKNGTYDYTIESEDDVFYPGVQGGKSKGYGLSIYKYGKYNLNEIENDRDFEKKLTRALDYDCNGVEYFGNLEFQKISDTEYSVVIFNGQSLSRGEQAIPRNIDPEPNCFQFSGNELVELRNTGSSWEPPMIACVNSLAHCYRQYNRKDGLEQKFIAGSVGEGASTISQLSKNSEDKPFGDGLNRYNRNFIPFLEKLVNLATTKNVKVSVSSIVWMQGEQDSAFLSDEEKKNEYKSMLAQLKNDMQEDIMTYLGEYGQSNKPLFYTYQVHYGGGGIKPAYIEAANENKDIVYTQPIYPFPFFGVHHLSSNGYRWFGEQVAKAIIFSNIYRIKSFPVVAKKCTVIDRKVIVINFGVPYPPLVFDNKLCQNRGGAAGVLVEYLDERYPGYSLSKTISKWELIGNSIVIYLQEELSVGETIYVNGNKGTNLRDSDKYQSLYTYLDDNDEEGISYKPTNEDGEVIVGEKYPMYNWADEFCFKVTIE